MRARRAPPGRASRAFRVDSGGRQETSSIRGRRTPGARRRRHVGQRLRQGAPQAPCRAGEAATLGAAQGPESLHPVRGARRCRQGRNDQGHHRTGQPACLSRRGAAGAQRPREEPDVHPALPAAPAGGRRSGHLRSQLVQPRRRRARHGLLHARADRRVPEGGSARRGADRPFGDHPAQVLARGQPRGADAAPEVAHRRRAQDLEAVARWT